jgi:uncharacterized protein (TIGR03437 family)
VNGASFTSNFAPYTIVSIFGTNLSWNTVALTADDIQGNVMPYELGGVQVNFDGYWGFLYYVSPSQVNFLIPASLDPGVFNFWLTRQGIRGPVIQITIADAAPALFLMPNGTPAATHLDGSLITSDAPASPGEIIVLYATGLGALAGPPLGDGVVPDAIKWLANMGQFGVQLGGTAIDSNLVLYAGVAPGYPGLYQVNLKLPSQLSANPELRLAVGNTLSPAGVLLPAK